MKKLVGFLIVMALMLVGVSVMAKETAPKVEINGVDVYSPYNHVSKEKLFVGVEGFFKVAKQRGGSPRAPRKAKRSGVEINRLSYERNPLMTFSVASVLMLLFLCYFDSFRGHYEYFR
ncbi:hypothetical protein [Priestia koreensis]|uniref:hypothetical protein n=1 Tax=Priestia koreensis TaxID=284581 RepID=UPI003458C903